jgi:hypothetical protein
VRSAVAHIRQYKSGQYYQDSFRGERSWNGYEHKVLLRNLGVAADGAPRFANVAMAVGADDIRDGRGMACGDLDNDGDLDIVMNTNQGDCGHVTLPPLVLRNDLGQKRNWLAVELEGTRCNRDAIGAEVRLACEGSESSKPYQAMRHVMAGSGYASQNDHRIHFGLDQHQVVSTIDVRWPGNPAPQIFKNIPANCWVRIREGRELEFFDPRGRPEARAVLAPDAQSRKD